jgi:Mn2+/Fe2+ NRAMP family transporter
MSAVQMISARVGRTTGHGIAGVLRRHYPNWLLQAIVVLLLTANTINLGADLGAMADAAHLLLPGPHWLYILFFAGVCIYMQVFLAYTRYVAVLKWLTLALFAYFAALVTTRVEWGNLASGIFLPRVAWSPEYLTAVVAVFGTTISPYLFFGRLPRRSKTFTLTHIANACAEHHSKERRRCTALRWIRSSGWHSPISWRSL